MIWRTDTTFPYFKIAETCSVPYALVLAYVEGLDACGLSFCALDLPIGWTSREWAVRTRAAWKAERARRGEANQ